MIAKLSVWGADREEAIARMRRALKEYVVTGIRTNIAFHDVVLTHPEFVDASYNTEFVANLLASYTPTKDTERTRASQIAAVLLAHMETEALQAPSSSDAGQSSVGTTDDSWTMLGRLAQQRRY
jgi:acetyl-CoA carboxylase biotin carboxylase subunit